MNNTLSAALGAPCGASTRSPSTINLLSLNTTTTAHPRNPPSSRRSLLIATTGSMLLFPSAFAKAITPDQNFANITLDIYQDPKDGFSISIPNGWIQGSGDLGGNPSQNSRYSNAAGLQRIIAWFPPGNPNANLAITIKTSSADFTSLGSFGTAQDFGENIVSEMDRSYLFRGRFQQQSSPPVTTAKLIDARERDGCYIIQYSTSKQGEPTRMIVSAVALGNAPNGIRRFFTVNGSWTEEENERYGNVLKNVVESFKPPALTY